MKLKHYLGALLMAGSVLAISFPADAISKKQAPVKPGISLIVKSIKNISKSDTRAIDWIPKSQAKQINEMLTKAKPITDKIQNVSNHFDEMLTKAKPIADTIENVSNELPQLVRVSHVVANPPLVVPTRTGTEEEVYQRARNGIAAGGTITVSSGTVVHLNSQNGNSERTPSPSSLKQIMMELHTGDSKKISERIPIRSPFKQTIVEIILFLI
jgi:hypothetical protein